MNNLSKDINAVKYLIDYMLVNGFEPYNAKPFSHYSRAYFCTNENIKNYLKIIDGKKNMKALCVLASGDHTFNLITKGIFNIDTFDLNNIAPYFALGLKRALIMKYNYLEYLKVNSMLTNRLANLEELTSFIHDLLPSLDKKERKFWKEISSYNYERQKNSHEIINLFYLITQNAMGFKKSERGNLYLESETSYLQLQKNIPKANITFQNTDIKNLNYKKYNLLLFSNILTYYERQYKIPFDFEERKRILNYLESLSEEEGLIYLNYLFENENLRQKANWQEIEKEGYSYLAIPPLSYLYDEDNVLYKRIK